MMERRIAWIRWLGIALGTIVAPFLGLGDQLIPVYAIIAAASAYNLICSRRVATGRPAWLLRAYTYGLFDTVTGTAIIAVTGGLESPFFLVYFLVIVNAAIRFGRWIALLSSALTALCYVSIVVLNGTGGTLDYAVLLLRVGFVAITALFAGFLSDRARAAELALAHQLDQARALNLAGSALTGSLEWSSVAQQITEQGRRLAEADVAILEFRELLPGTDGVNPLIAHKRITSALPSGAYLAKVFLQSGLLAKLSRPESGRVTIHNLAEADSLLSQQVTRLPHAPLLRAPILLHNQWVGDLLLLRVARDNPFVATDADIVRAFVNQAALALENARLYQRAREQAGTDPITGLPNHRSLKERLDEELVRARRHGREMSVLMLDIDHFKAFNDAFGHAAGDGALCKVAETLRRSLRRGDYAARYAGEEFVVVLPDTDVQRGAALAERLREAIASLVDDPASHLSGPLTVSIGVATFPDHGSDRDMLLQAADLAMYMAKHIGRNQVCLATELGTARGLEALFAQLSSHLALPTARWGPHIVADLERRFTRLASLRDAADGPELTDAAETAYRHTIQTVTALAATIDAKDHYTDGHSRYVSALGMALARAAGCSDEMIELVRVGGLLHDIGKIGIPEAILNKPDCLTGEEHAIMRSHPDIGARILAPISALTSVIPIVRHHHERWDGCGYPLRMQAEEIPLGARIIAICDAYDTMVSDRPYRRGLGHQEAIARLLGAAGTQFDPTLVGHFVGLSPGTAGFAVLAHDRSGAAAD